MHTRFTAAVCVLYGIVHVALIFASTWRLIPPFSRVENHVNSFVSKQTPRPNICTSTLRSSVKDAFVEGTLGGASTQEAEAVTSRTGTRLHMSRVI